VFQPRDFLLENPPRLVIDLPRQEPGAASRRARQERARHACPGVPVPVSSGPGDPSGSRPGPAASALPGLGRRAPGGPRARGRCRAGRFPRPIANLLRPVANADRRASGPCGRRCAAAGEGREGRPTE
jgi:hypothetical protein